MLTRKAGLALSTVLDIAHHARPEPVSTRDIAKRQQIARRTLEHVMQPLVKAGILKGQRGPKGGYWLGRERRRISAGEILRAAEEDAFLADTHREAKMLVLRHLDKITLEDLICARQTGNGPEKTHSENAQTEKTQKRAQAFNFTI